MVQGLGFRASSDTEISSSEPQFFQCRVPLYNRKVLGGVPTKGHPFGRNCDYRCSTLGSILGPPPHFLESAVCFTASSSLNKRPVMLRDHHLFACSQTCRSTNPLDTKGLVVGNGGILEAQRLARKSTLILMGWFWLMQGL